MARFFVDRVEGNNYTLEGEDALHITKSLRMKEKDRLTLCDINGVEYECEIKSVGVSVEVLVLESKACENEPTVKVTLYQGLPKSDKMELIIQKAVELGVTRIVPLITSRCISRPDTKSMEKKIKRWQKIAKEAAKQSRRGLIPKIDNIIDLKDIRSKDEDEACFMVFYENGGEKIRNIINKKPRDISIIVGPEGGFSEEEIAFLSEQNVKIATLGKRILRTETAPLAAL